ncbi:hypothetical protein ACKWTF_004265 [Chironomus riparius]
MKVRERFNDTASEVEKAKHKRISKKRKTSSSEEDLNGLFNTINQKQTANKKSRLQKVTALNTNSQTTTVKTSSASIMRKDTQRKIKQSSSLSLKTIPVSQNTSNLKSSSQLTRLMSKKSQVVASVSNTSEIGDSDLDEENEKSLKNTVVTPELLNDSNMSSPVQFREHFFGNSNFNEFSNELSSTRVNQEQYGIESRLQKLEDKMEILLSNQELIFSNQKSIMEHLEALGSSIGGNRDRSSSNNSSVDISSIAPIKDRDSFLSVEKMLAAHRKQPTADKDFSKKRSAMVNYYKSHIRPIGSAAPKNSLMLSLLEMYFESNFIDNLCWTDTVGCVCFNKCEGHFDLFFDIIEAHTPGTYSSLGDSSTAVKIYLHRRREKQAKKAKEINRQSQPNIEYEDND